MCLFLLCSLTCFFFLSLFRSFFFFFFFFNDTATTEIYTLSLHDALPICNGVQRVALCRIALAGWRGRKINADGDRKSTRLNSSHQIISYAVFCLKKKKRKMTQHERSTSRDTITHVSHSTS